MGQSWSRGIPDCLGKDAEAGERKKDETLSMKKSEDQYIFPTRPVFAPVIKPELFENVKKKLDARPHVNDSFGMLNP